MVGLSCLISGGKQQRSFFRAGFGISINYLLFVKWEGMLHRSLRRFSILFLIAQGLERCPNDFRMVKGQGG